MENFSNHKSRVESASSSMKQAQVERWSDMLDSSLSDINDPAEWKALTIQINEVSPNLTDQQEDDIKTAVDILQHYQSSSDKNSILRGAGKLLPEIARAFRTLESYSARNVVHFESFMGALQRLERAVGELATEEEVKAATEAMGLMSDEEVQKAKEQISK